MSVQFIHQSMTSPFHIKSVISLQIGELQVNWWCCWLCVAISSQSRGSMIDQSAGLSVPKTASGCLAVRNRLAQALTISCHHPDFPASLHSIIRPDQSTLAIWTISCCSLVLCLAPILPSSLSSVPALWSVLPTNRRPCSASYSPGYS